MEYAREIHNQIISHYRTKDEKEPIIAGLIDSFLMIYFFKEHYDIKYDTI